MSLDAPCDNQRQRPTSQTFTDNIKYSWAAAAVDAVDEMINAVIIYTRVCQAVTVCDMFTRVEPITYNQSLYSLLIGCVYSSSDVVVDCLVSL